MKDLIQQKHLKWLLKKTLKGWITSKDYLQWSKSASNTLKVSWKQRIKKNILLYLKRSSELTKRLERITRLVGRPSTSQSISIDQRIEEGATSLYKYQLLVTIFRSWYKSFKVLYLFLL